MRTYKAKSGGREVEAVQYDGSFGQRKGISFHLVRHGFIIEHVGASGIGILNSSGDIRYTILAPGGWLVQRVHKKKATGIRKIFGVQFMSDKDFRRAYEVTHG